MFLNKLKKNLQQVGSPRGFNSDAEEVTTKKSIYGIIFDAYCFAVLLSLITYTIVISLIKITPWLL